MKFQPIFLIIGVLIATLGSSMTLPLLVAAFYDQTEVAAFTTASLVTLLVGTLFYYMARGHKAVMSLREMFFMTTVAWLFLAFFGALPYYWSNSVPTFTDAFFESMSGLTTTGSTVMTGLDEKPKGILFWRAFQQWLGGLGIIVMAVAILPILQVGGMQLFKAEAFDTPDKVVPRTTQLSGSLTSVFIIITMLCMIAYWLAGMSFFDAITHAMTTVATGGYSTHDLSMGYFDSATIDYIAIFFMILGSLPFLLYVQAFQGYPGYIFQDSQVRVFIILIILLVSIIWIYEYKQNIHAGSAGLRYAMFNVVSVLTGTGYATDAYDLWGPFSTGFFLIIMFIGGCSGSTACGIKIFRFQVAFGGIFHYAKQIIHPHGIFVRHFNKRRIPDDVISSVMNFLFIYLSLYILIALLLSLTGLDPVTALSGAATSISNVGPGLGPIIGPAGTFQPLSDSAKWILSIAMLIGRLELITVLVLFIPAFWRI